MNLLEKICKELGVEIGEKWLANDGYYYKITEDGMIGFYFPTSANEVGFDIDPQLWTNLVIGELKPVWKPKDGEMYYVPRFTHDENHRYWADVWRNGKWDNWAYNNKLIFKTKQEAINCTNEMIALAKHGI